MAAQNNTPADGLGLKHPLSVTVGAGLDNLTRLGLKTETTMNDPVEEAGEFSEMLISAHAPSVSSIASSLSPTRGRKRASYCVLGVC